MTKYQYANCKALVARLVEMAAIDYVDALEGVKCAHDNGRDKGGLKFEKRAHREEVFLRGELVGEAFDLEMDYLIPELRKRAGFEEGEEVYRLMSYD